MYMLTFLLLERTNEIVLKINFDMLMLWNLNFLKKHLTNDSAFLEFGYVLNYDHWESSTQVCLLWKL